MVESNCLRASLEVVFTVYEMCDLHSLHRKTPALSMLEMIRHEFAFFDFSRMVCELIFRYDQLQSSIFIRD